MKTRELVLYVLMLCCLPALLLAQAAAATAPASPDGMTGGAIITVSAAVVALVQLFKWIFNPPDRWGGAAVLAIGLVGVVFWGWSHADLTRTNSWDYFAAWVAVSTSAAGVFGFTRTAADQVAAFRNKP
jgi:NAD(P)-dependent dehydrogenase (short-subunit alcohol dehydrogenase family)